MASIINADNGVVSGSAGLKTSADSTGVLALQTNGTTAVTVDTSQNATFVNSANLPNTFGFKNRIINGDMRIDQRNAGAAVTISASFPIDRFLVSLVAGESAFSAQQDTSAPDGFTTSTKITVTTAEVSVGADDRFAFQQRIEGTNVADLNWGATAASASKTAATVTLSFWVRSSVTGTFGGALRNSANDRCYPFTYSISTANTWEKKSITIVGDTSGTWLTTTGIGVVVNFSLMAGTNYVGTAGAWTAAGVQGATGQTQLFSTLNATWYITGVQLEKGSTATSFDVRPYGTELQLCQRYYIAYLSRGLLCISGSATIANGGLTFLVQMRATPTISGDNITRMTNAGSTDYDGSYTFATNWSTANGCSVKYTAATSTFGGTGVPLAINDSGGASTMRIYANAEL
jgi:hypothetical protein